MDLISTMRMALFLFLVRTIIKIRVTLVRVTADVLLAYSPEKMVFHSAGSTRSAQEHSRSPCVQDADLGT